MNSEELSELTSKVPLFACLTTRERTAVGSVMIAREYEKNGCILHEEDNESQTFFIIAAGSVHVAVLSQEGKQTILATLKRGDFFGEMSILDGEPRSASVIAAESCVLLMLYRNKFLELLQDYPKITIQMLVEMSKRLRRSNRHINTLSMMSVYGRVAEVILRIAQESGRKIGDMVVIDKMPSQQTLADMASTTRETVSRILSQLQKKHYISIDRKKLVILDEKKLYD